jgi:hypothetical protein
MLARMLGTGIPPSELNKLIECGCLVDIKEDNILYWDFF